MGMWYTTLSSTLFSGLFFCNTVWMSSRGHSQSLWLEQVDGFCWEVLGMDDRCRMSFKPTYSLAYSLMINLDSLFQRDINVITQQWYEKRKRITLPHTSYFTNRVIHHWRRLQPSIFRSHSINSLKSSLGKYYKDLEFC